MTFLEAWLAALGEIDYALNEMYEDNYATYCTICEVGSREDHCWNCGRHYTRHGGIYAATGGPNYTDPLYQGPNTLDTFKTPHPFFEEDKRAFELCTGTGDF